MSKDDRYKINVIPCNTNTIKEKASPKARSVDDMDILDKQRDLIEYKISSKIVNDFKPSFLEKLTIKHLEMIANRTQSIQRKMIKTRSIYHITIQVSSISRSDLNLSYLRKQTNSATITKSWPA
jgi:hypothetical protein